MAGRRAEDMQFVLNQGSISMLISHSHCIHNYALSRSTCVLRKNGRGRFRRKHCRLRAIRFLIFLWDFRFFGRGRHLRWSPCRHCKTILDSLYSKIGCYLEICMTHRAILKPVWVISFAHVISATWVEIVWLERVDMPSTHDSSFERVRLSSSYVIVFVKRSRLFSPIDPSEGTSILCASLCTINIHSV